MARFRSTPHDTKGMPPGIPYIIGNELAERFSFYGMNAILTIFLTKHLLDSAGQPDFLNDEEAKSVFHLFKMLAYLFPIFGAILSDVLWGKYKTILLISLMYCLGHGMLALMDLGPHMGWWDMAPFMYAGLLLIAIGSGGIKPCVSAHVGDQFGPNNKRLITQVFNWFYFSINVGAATATLLTPILLAKVGPWLAFGIPGVLMAVATSVFWLGRNRFVHVPPAGWTAFKRETFSPEGVRAMKNLAPLFLIFIPVFWSIFDQTASSWVIQANAMDREFAGVTWLESQIQAANPILILTLIPIFTYFVYPTVNKIVRVTPLRKIGFGLFLSAVAFGASGLIETRITGGSIDSTTMRASDEPSSFFGQPYFDPRHLIDGEADGRGFVSHPVAWDSAESARPEIVIRLRERQAWTIEQIQINPAAHTGGLITPDPPSGEEPTLEAHIASAELQNADEAVQRASFGRALAEHRVAVAAYESYQREAARRVDLDGAARDALEAAPDTPSFTTRVELLYHAPKDYVEDPDDKTKRVMNWRSLGEHTLAPEDRLQSVSFEPVEASFIKVRILASNGGLRAKLGEIRAIAAGTPSARAQSDGVWPDVASVGFRPNVGWQFLAYLLMTAAEILVSIVALEFAYTQSPRKMKSFVMGIFFLGVSLGNAFAAAVNAVLIALRDPAGLTPLEGANYFWFFTAITLLTAVIFVFYSRTYKGETFIQGEEDDHSHEPPEEPEGADKP